MACAAESHACQHTRLQLTVCLRLHNRTARCWAIGTWSCSPPAVRRPPWTGVGGGSGWEGRRYQTGEVNELGRATRIHSASQYAWTGGTNFTPQRWLAAPGLAASTGRTGQTAGRVSSNIGVMWPLAGRVRQ